MAFDSNHDANFDLPGSPSLARKALEPVTGYPGEYRKHLNASVTAMSGGLEDMRSGQGTRTIVGAFRTGAGAIGYVLSPLTAATRSWVGKPAERFTRAAGGSEGLSRFVGDTADIGANVALGTGLVRGASAFARTATGPSRASGARAALEGDRRVELYDNVMRQSSELSITESRLAASNRAIESPDFSTLPNSMQQGLYAESDALGSMVLRQRMDLRTAREEFARLRAAQSDRTVGLGEP